VLLVTYLLSTRCSLLATLSLPASLTPGSTHEPLPVPPSQRADSEQVPDRTKANSAPCSLRWRRMDVAKFNTLICFIFFICGEEVRRGWLSNSGETRPREVKKELRV
jgi:hypothetical protein